MNPEFLLVEVGRKMLTAATGSIGLVRICWIDSKIQCLNSADRRAPEAVITRFPAHRIVTGLNPTEWSRLKKKLATFMKNKR